METHSLGKLSHFLPGQWNIEVGDFRKQHASHMKEKKSSLMLSSFYNKKLLISKLPNERYFQKRVSLIKIRAKRALNERSLILFYVSLIRK